MITVDILTELELWERAESVRKDILLDGRRREKYLNTLLRNAELDQRISWYESQMRVNY